MRAFFIFMWPGGNFFKHFLKQLVNDCQMGKLRLAEKTLL